MVTRRYRYLNLVQIRLPLPGIVSIGHRLSGVLMIIALPFALAALQCSLASEESYRRVIELMQMTPMKLLAILVAWAFFHHLCAGIRFLLLDFHLGVSLAAARRSALAVFGGGVLLALSFGVWLW